MSGITTTASVSKLLWPGVMSVFGDVYPRYEMEFKEIFEVRKSDKRYEQVVGMVPLGLSPVKNEGDSVAYSAIKQGFISQFTNVMYAKGVVVSLEALEDFQYAPGLAERIGRDLAVSMRQTIETVAASVLNNAFSSSFLGGDGKALCVTDHPLAGISGSTFSNRASTDADLSEAALEQAVIDIAAFVDDAGVKVQMKPTKLIVPRQLMFDARRILESDYKVGSADNDINAIMGYIPGGWSVNHFLTDVDAWFLKIECPDSLIMMDRADYAITSDDDFDTSNSKFKIMNRFSVGWANPRGIYGSQGS